MEEYTIVTENRDNGQNTRIGVYAKHILEMHKKKYGETAATTVLDRAIRIFSESQKQLADGDINNNVLLVGKVQSGKTSNLEMLSGLAFDNGYNLLIIYGGYDKTLLKQTTDRFRKTYGIEDIAEEGKPVLLSTSDPAELAALNDEIFRDLLEAGKPVIITSMKRPTALEKVNETIRKLDSDKVHAYIIDDEGDQASLNTAKNRAEDCSATYEKIVNMKQLLNDPLYFSVTATPHANIFLDEISELIPGSAKLIEPGVGYCGGECYHMGNSEHIFSIDPDDTVVMDEGRMPDSLKLAVMHFVLASVITRKRSIKDSTMIIHSYRNRDPHSLIYTMVDTLRQEWINRLEDAETSLLLLDEFKNVYESLFDEEIRNRYPFDSIISDIKNVIKKVYVILKNSDGAATQGFEAIKKHRIYIGGDLLQRGVTFDNLVTTYYTRWAAQGNMDTNLQRARWFGYREDCLDVCKIFTTKEISEQYSILTDIELELWEQFYDVQEGNMQIRDMVISADGTNQRPTRSNVVTVRKLYFKKNWMKQRQGLFDINLVEDNNKKIKAFLDQQEMKMTTVGRNDDKESARYAEVDSQLFVELMNSLSGIFEHDPFNKEYLYRLLSEERKVNIIYMSDNNGEGRKRSFYSDNNINNIHPGPDKSNVSERKFLGDSAVVINKEMINIQIHLIRPYKQNEEISHCKQYMFAIYIPRAKKYYIGSDD